MNQQKSERLFARILFKYVSNSNRGGREICYIYNRESFNELNKIKLKIKAMIGYVQIRMRCHLSLRTTVEAWRSTGIDARQARNEC